MKQYQGCDGLCRFPVEAPRGSRKASGTYIQCLAGGRRRADPPFTGVPNEGHFPCPLAAPWNNSSVTLTGLLLSLETRSAAYSMERGLRTGYRPFKAVIWRGSSTIWTKCVALSLASFLVLILPKVLDTLDPASPAFRRCLGELRHICGTRTILPPSYTLSSQDLEVGLHPVAADGSGDLYMGTFNGLRVCVKRVRIHSKDNMTKVTRVRYRRHHFSIRGF